MAASIQHASSMFWNLNDHISSFQSAGQAVVCLELKMSVGGDEGKSVIGFSLPKCNPATRHHILRGFVWVLAELFQARATY